MTEHTPGPWIAASHQSHIVGIPIVGPNGESIGFAATRAGITTEGKEFNKRSLVNAQLMASAPTLAARLAEAERDAARYRWLRDSAVHFGYDDHRMSPWCVEGHDEADCSPCCGADLDASIDAARAADSAGGAR